MSEPVPNGVDRAGLDAAFAAAEARKSALLLTAQALRAQRQDEAAAANFAEAAGIEELLAERAANSGLQEKAWVHEFSAASCWAQAGNFYFALAGCDRLLAEKDLPARLRQQVGDYAVELRTRRARWYGELLHAEAVAHSPVH